ncbi:hypothetical protein RND59_11390 [Vibrio ruber]|uniref:hypothetical protein n=1 Tax=Vibrio ruber TaxID=184755 RepID=UPI0028937173|nr:hypothetical protein [Vibrio ruber]WNJ94735.1 hypothetical protein RND59_11390 [Vibrio ruber]
MMSDSTIQVLSDGFTWSSLLQIAMTEWVVIEFILIVLFIFNKNKKRIIAIGFERKTINIKDEGKLNDFIFMSVVAAFIVGLLTMSLFIGQSVISLFTQVSFSFYAL